MYTHFYSPNIVATGSSELDQSSYSHHADNDVGVAVIDRWTYYVLEFLETQVTSATSKLNLGDLFDSYDESKIHSQPGVRWDLFPGGEQEGRLRTVVDFFGNVQNVEVENANATEPGSLKEDLAEIARLVEKWQKRDVEYSAILNSSQANNDQHSSVHLSRRKTVGPTRMADEGSWGKRLVGISVIGLCTAVWVAGSYLGRALKA